VVPISVNGGLGSVLLQVPFSGVDNSIGYVSNSSDAGYAEENRHVGKKKSRSSHFELKVRGPIQLTDLGHRAAARRPTRHPQVRFVNRVHGRTHRTKPMVRVRVRQSQGP
jgi:hypothetical protein